MSNPLGYVSKTGHGTYFRETITPELAALEHGGKKMWTPVCAVNADLVAENAALRDRCERLTGEVTGMKRFRFEEAEKSDATIAKLREHVRVLREALKFALSELDEMPTWSNTGHVRALAICALEATK